ncbi:polymorphic toxin-type HINT domain-containing protein [Paenibacillus sp. FSL R7-0313]|uniref:polymorphic toxin-type HINT domain-containing protein n=1 Tax=Paenibacillus sp. FSL R7-0313 TaxID=2954532 RepID=UPI0030D75928
MKKTISIILIVAILSGLMGNVIPTISYAEDEGAASPETIQILMDEFGTTASFIQRYLDQGYNLNEIVAAFYKARESGLSFDEALRAIHPEEVNESATVTSDVYTDPLIENESSIISVEADQSGIMQRYDTFTVTEEVYSDAATDPISETDDNEEKITEEKEDPTVQPSDLSMPDPNETELEPEQEPESSHPEDGKQVDEGNQGEKITSDSNDTDNKEKTTSGQEEKSVSEESKIIQPLAASTGVPDPGKHVSEKAPVFDRNSFNEAPYSVGENGETISTLSGGLILEHTDATLPGRGGLTFNLERQYNSTSAQFYDMDVGYNTYEYPIYQYFVTYNAVKKKKIPIYHVKYTENMSIQWDNNGDGVVDSETAIIETKTLKKGTYTTESEAKEVASHRIVYFTEPEPLFVQKTQYNNQDNFPATMAYNEGGFIGTLNKSGSAKVISGQHTPAQTITAPQQTCINEIAGKYDAKGNWVQTGTGSPCPEIKTATVQGKTITLTRTSVTNTKACLSPNKAGANYPCTKSWTAYYNGSVTIPASDTRSYSQSYAGTVVKPGSYSSRKYDSWVSLGNGAKQRKVYNVNEKPWVETEITEGSAVATTLATDGTELWSQANTWKDTFNANPGFPIPYPFDDGYNYYIAAQPAGEIRAYQVGSNTDVTYFNKTVSAAADKRTPLGKGWSWKLPYIEKENDKSFAVMADGGRYEIVGNKLKDTDWEGTTVTSNTSVTVNGETSQQVITSADGLSKQYFTTDGRLLQLSDSRQNDIQFIYEQNTSYQSKLLTQVKDAIGNTIQIDYSPSAVTIRQGDRTVTYQKKTQNGIELLDSVIDPLGRKTTYSYKMADAKFNLLGFSPERAVSNPYALLTSVHHQTGAKTFYDYENSAVKRYIGADSLNEAYRILTRKDQLTYENGTTEDYNRQTVSYTSDLGASYGKKSTFGATIRDGLTETQYAYRKEVLSIDASASYYLDRMTVSGEGLIRTTAYTYEKMVKGHNLAATEPTTVTVTDNQTKDTMTSMIQYDDYGNVTFQKDPTGKTVTSAYDENRHWLTSITETVDSSNKKFSVLARNAQGDITQVISRKNNVNGEIISQADYTFDTYSNLLVQRLKNGTHEQATTVEYDSIQAYPVKKSTIATDVDGKKSTVTTTTSYHPADGSLMSSVDAAQRTTAYGYDALGRIIQVNQTDGSVLRATYDDNENRITVTDENGQKRIAKWNALGQRIETGYYKGSSYIIASRTGYDPYGREIWNEDSLGNRTSSEYDAWNRIISTIGADGSIKTVKYNDTERTARTTDAEGYVQIQTFDRWGQMIKVEEKAQQEKEIRLLQKMTYDVISGKLLEETDGKEQTTSNSYDIQGQLIEVKSPNGEQTRYAYDMLGNLVQTTDAAGNVKQSRYDELGRRIQTTDKQGNTIKSYFNRDGTLSRFIDRNGNNFSYDYDERGNLLAKRSPEEIIQFQVNRVGQRTSMTDKTGTMTYEYDSATEQLQRITYPDGKQTTFEYDSNGNRTSMTGPFGTIVYYSYDTMNRLISVGTAKDIPDMQYKYYMNGLSREAIAKNGVQDLKTYQGLDLIGLNQVQSQVKLDSYVYDYDNNKNIVNRVHGETTDTFSYDKLDRIMTSTVSQEEYTYDNQGNRLTMITDTEFEVEDRDYTYDMRDRLTSVQKNAKQVSYKYNGDNLLVERTENGKVTRYYYDDNAQIIAEAEVSNSTPSLKANYIRGTKLEAIQYADGTKAYVQSNGHGDITELRDEQGKLLNQYDYDIWGNIITNEETVHNPFRYAGELWDDTTELQYLRARWYDPTMGRFINEDTFEGELSDPLSQNVYSYVSNNPLKYVDPSGHIKDSTYYEIEFMLKESMSLKSKSADYWSNRSQLGVIFQKVYGDRDNMTFKFRYGVLTQTSPYSQNNTKGKADWARQVLLADLDAYTDRTWALAQSVESIIYSATGLVGSTKGKVIIKGCNCFTAGTKVQTDEGQKNIEDIEIGDMVLAKDENNPNGEVDYKEVTNLFRNQRDDIIKLYAGDQIIETTDNHPFWVEGKGWLFANKLHEGDKLLKADGSSLSIRKVEFVNLNEPVTVYNFTVADYHTYYVTDLGIWVHNTECSLSARTLATMGKTNTKIAGLEGSYISKNTALFTAVEFVGPGYTKGTAANGYTTYVSKDGRYVARYGYKKHGGLELNLEDTRTDGNFHISVK